MFKLGNDSFGKSYLDALKKEQIITDFVGLTSEALTGNMIVHRFV